MRHGRPALKVLYMEQGEEEVHGFALTSHGGSTGRGIFFFFFFLASLRVEQDLTENGMSEGLLPCTLANQIS